MSDLRVGFVCNELDKIWVQDITMWSRPLPRLRELILMTLSDFADEDSHEPCVRDVVWSNTQCNADVFLYIGTPFSRSDTQRIAQWLIEHGFRELVTAQKVEEYFGVEGLAIAMAAYDKVDTESAVST